YAADDPKTPATLRVLAPPGAFSGVQFLWGLNDVCNDGDTNRDHQLSPTAQLSWPAGLGYLFLRYEALSSGTPASSTPPAAIHMGGLPRLPLAPLMTIAGDVVVPASGTVTKAVRVSMDAIFEGATKEVDL